MDIPYIPLQHQAHLQHKRFIMKDLTKALISLYPGAQWTLNGEEYSGLTWLEGNDKPKPTQKELEDEADRLHQVWLNNQYQRDRAKEYPPITNQLDMLYWDKVNGTDNWEKAIKEIKDKFPKVS
jgi:hypothetical protein